MNSLTIKVYIASGYNANKGKLILNNVEYSFDNVMPDSDNAYELYFGFANPITLPATGQLFIIDASDEIKPFNHNGTIQVNQGYGIYNYDYNNPCYMEFELEEDGQAYGDPSIEFGSVSNPWYYNQYVVSSCNTPTTHTVSLSCDVSKGRVCYSTDGTTWSTPLASTSTTVNNADVIYIKANPETGYQFQKWSDDSTSNPNTLIVTSDVTMSAVFVEAQPVVYENTVVFTGATVSQVDIDADNGEGYVTFNIVNNTIQFDDGDFWSMKKLTTANGDIVSSVDYSYPDGTTGTNTITNPEDQIAGHYEDPGTMNITINSTFPYAIPDLTGRRFGNVEGEESWYFTAQNAVHYQNGCGEGATSLDLNITAWVWNDSDSWPQNCWAMQTDGDFSYFYDPAEDKFYDNYFDYYPEIYYDLCNPPAEKHIYLCDNSGAHLAEMTNTGSTWNVSGAFTSGQYSIRATVEGEYNDAWFKFYQTSGDNRVFVGAGDDPSFEDIGTYIMIDDILTSFSLTEDQETGYYVVNYQNTDAMTVSTVETIVNSYIGDFVTGSEISAMGYMTATDISSMGYMTQTDISSMGYMTATDISAMSYVDSTSLSNMSYITMTDVQSLGYIDQTSLSAMSYVDNSYLSTYMSAVVGDINSILQTI